MCADVGIQGFKTNNSLRVTTATRLFQAGVDEQLIMKRTGHRSLDGIHLYKRISSDQEEKVSQVLNSVGEDLVPAVVKKLKLATTSSIDSSVLPFSVLTVQMSKLKFRRDSVLYSVLYSFYLQIIKKLSERFSTFPRSILSVPGGIITVPGGFILRFINLLFCNLIGQFVLCMVECRVMPGPT